MTLRIKSKKIYKRNKKRNKFSKKGRKRVTRRVSNRMRKKMKVTRKGGGPKRAKPSALAREQEERDKAAREQEQAALEQAALEQAVIQENSQMLEEFAKLAALRNNQNIEIKSSSCVNGPDYFELPGYCEFLDYIKGLTGEEREEAEKIKREVNKRKGLLRGEIGRNVFQELPRPEYIAFQLDKLIKMVIVNVAGKYTILWAYANMLNYNYAEDYFKKWVTKNPNEPFRIESRSKPVVLITREIIRNIEKDPRFIRLLVSKNLLLTRSYNLKNYDKIINLYFSTLGYDMANTVFICPIYEIPHSAIANDYNGRQLQMSREDIPRPLIYAGLEGVFYIKDEKKCFVIANLSGHYKTPKDRMEFVKEVLKTYYGYADIRVISDPPPPSASSMESDSSDAGPREEWRRFITNDDSIITFDEALQKLNSADSTPVVDSSTYETLFSQGSQGTGSIASQRI
jgi:tetratricopeptide (TPR) repeat protein